MLFEEDGKYISVFDPLDGSSNIDAGIPVGTIFGIFEEDDGCRLPDEFFDDEDMGAAMEACLRSTLKPGKSLVAAGYALYSSATHFVFTLGDGVNGFTLDESIGEFILTHPDIRVPPRGTIYSVNEVPLCSGYASVCPCVGLVCAPVCARVRVSACVRACLCVLVCVYRLQCVTGVLRTAA